MEEIVREALEETVTEEIVREALTETAKEEIVREALAETVTEEIVREALVETAQDREAVRVREILQRAAADLIRFRPSRRATVRLRRTATRTIVMTRIAW